MSAARLAFSAKKKIQAESVGLKWEDFKITDSSCAPHPPRKRLSGCALPAACVLSSAQESLDLGCVSRQTCTVTFSVKKKVYAESVGLKWETFKITDNSCAPHSPRKGLSRVRPAGCLLYTLCV